jgi:hypothetical protein
MTTLSDQALDALLKRLHLANTRRAWRELTQRAEQEEWSYRDFLALTHASLTMDLVLQFLRGHLHNGNAPMRELVDELRTARACDLRGLRLGDLALGVPKQRRCDAHFVHELGGRQAR